MTETPYYWGVHEDVYCAGKEGTFQFLEDVLTEVMAIFPCTYLHIGGDEVRLAALLSLPFAHHCRQEGKALSTCCTVVYSAAIFLRMRGCIV